MTNIYQVPYYPICNSSKSSNSSNDKPCKSYYIYCNNKQIYINNIIYQNTHSCCCHKYQGHFTSVINNSCGISYKDCGCVIDHKNYNYYYSKRINMLNKNNFYCCNKNLNKILINKLPCNC